MECIPFKCPESTRIPFECFLFLFLLVPSQYLIEVLCLAEILDKKAVTAVCLIKVPLVLLFNLENSY